MKLKLNLPKIKPFLLKHKWLITFFLIVITISYPFLLLFLNWLTGKSIGELYTFELPLKDFLTPWIAFWVAIGAAFNVWLMQRRVSVMEKQQRDTRFSSGVELLGNPNESARIGGAYNLYFLASEFPDDYLNPVCEILCAHVRTITSDKAYQEKYSAKPSNEIQTILDFLFKKNKKSIFENCFKNLSNSFLSCTSFFECSLTDVAFSQSTLTNFYFNTATLTDVNFYGATLTDVDFYGATLTNVNFTSSTLTDVDFRTSSLTYINFYDAKLTKANFDFSKLTKANFTSATLTKVTFSLATLTEVDFDSAKLTRVYFNISKLTNVNFTSSKLTDVDFNSATLTDVKFFGAKLYDVNFYGATLTDVDFRHTVFENYSYEEVSQKWCSITLPYYQKE